MRRVARTSRSADDLMTCRQHPRIDIAIGCRYRSSAPRRHPNKVIGCQGDFRRGIITTNHRQSKGSILDYRTVVQSIDRRVNIATVYGAVGTIDDTPTERKRRIEDIYGNVSHVLVLQGRADIGACQRIAALRDDIHDQRFTLWQHALNITGGIGVGTDCIKARLRLVSRKINVRKRYWVSVLILKTGIE